MTTTPRPPLAKPRRSTVAAPQSSSPANGVSSDGSLGVGRLVELLDRQREVYEQLKALSHQQAQMISSESPEGLLGVLSARQHLVDELGKLNSDLEPYRGQWSSFWGRLGSDDQARVNGLLNQAEQLLAGIIEQDNRDRQELEQSRDRIHRELGRVVQSGAALQAYRTGRVAAQNRFTDQQG